MLRRSRAMLMAALTALSVMALTVPAFASPTPVDNANTAVSDAATSATGIITSNIPVVLAVTGAFVALRFGKKLIKAVTG